MSIFSRFFAGDNFTNAINRMDPLTGRNWLDTGSLNQYLTNKTQISRLLVSDPSSNISDMKRMMDKELKNLHNEIQTRMMDMTGNGRYGTKLGSKIGKILDSGNITADNLKSAKKLQKTIKTWEKSLNNFSKHSEKFIENQTKTFVDLDKTLSQKFNNPNIGARIFEAQKSLSKYGAGAGSFLTRGREYADYMKGQAGKIIKGYNPVSGALSEQTSIMSHFVLQQIGQQFFSAIQTGLEQEGDSLRQKGEIMIRQGDPTEGLRVFEQGSRIKTRGTVAGAVGSGLLNAGISWKLLGNINPWIKTLAIGAELGTAAYGAVQQNKKDNMEIELQKKEARFDLAAQNKTIVGGFRTFRDDELYAGIVKDYRKDRSGAARTKVTQSLGFLKKNLREAEAAGIELEKELSDLHAKYGKDFENAPVEELTDIRKKQFALTEHTKNATYHRKRYDTLKSELESGDRFLAAQRIAGIGTSTAQGLFNATVANTFYDERYGHGLSMDVYGSNASILKKEHDKLTAELKRTQAESDGSDYYVTQVENLKNKIFANEQKSYQNQYNKDAARTRINKMQFALEQQQSDMRMTDLMNNQYSTPGQFKDMMQSFRNKNIEIDKQIAEAKTMGESEEKYAILADLQNKRNTNVSNINKLGTFLKQDYGNMLGGITGSKYLTDQLGSFSKWAGQTNPLGRLVKDGNDILRKILEELRNPAENYASFG